MAFGSGAGISGINKAWEQARPPFPLRTLSILYALGWRVYESLYRLKIWRRVVLPVPVIGVGSLWVGGVGKTPITIAIARHFHQKGKRVAVLAHGYGGRRYQHITLIEPHQPADPVEVGDEASEIRMALPEVPVAVGKWRVAVAQSAIERWRPDLLILDDGFQHLPLARTVDLVLLPAEKSFGNGYCLPAGPLREPPTGRHRAHAILWVGKGQPPSVEMPSFRVSMRVCAPVPLVNAETSPSITAPQKVHGITAIARPERFVSALQAQGWQFESIATYPDHHHFQDVDFSVYAGKTVLTTAKDGVKLRTLLPSDCRAYIVPLTAHIEAPFWEWIRAFIEELG